MKNKALHDLNFKKLLEYPEVFQPQNYYEDPIPCERFCIECETSGTLAKAGGTLTLMSHGCDSSDFESILGSRPNVANDINDPIMFLLEDPGGDDGDIRNEVTQSTVTKKIPTTHYYFSPTVSSWPQTIGDVIQNKNFYGTYFAYLMQRHCLANVYITNMVKCKKEPKGNRSLIEEKCVSKFLSREIQAFEPKLVFCFRKEILPVMQFRFPNIPAVWLYHPVYIQAYCRRHHRTPTEVAQENDQRIEAALADAGMKV
jgi:hypothetical protein